MRLGHRPGLQFGDHRCGLTGLVGGDQPHQKALLRRLFGTQCGVATVEDVPQVGGRSLGQLPAMLGQ
ncbi:MAG: hypothetical protein WBB05_12965 [Mycolicibacterium fortuitum]